MVQAASQEAVESFLAFLPGPGYLRIRLRDSASASGPARRLRAANILASPRGYLVTGTTSGPACQTVTGSNRQSQMVITPEGLQMTGKHTRRAGAALRDPEYAVFPGRKAQFQACSREHMQGN